VQTRSAAPVQRFKRTMLPSLGRCVSEMTSTTSIAIIAIVAVLALLGVVAVTILTVPLQQEAEARGCPAGTPAPNASKLRCFKG
jgi:hypothetical protein